MNTSGDAVPGPAVAQAAPYLSGAGQLFCHALGPSLKVASFQGTTPKNRDSERSGVGTERYEFISASDIT